MCKKKQEVICEENCVSFSAENTRIWKAVKNFLFLYIKSNQNKRIIAKQMFHYQFLLANFFVLAKTIFGENNSRFMKIV
jgi:hypothetical protein